MPGIVTARPPARRVPRHCIRTCRWRTTRIYRHTQARVAQYTQVQGSACHGVVAHTGRGSTFHGFTAHDAESRPALRPFNGAPLCACIATRPCAQGQAMPGDFIEPSQPATAHLSRDGSARRARLCPVMLLRVASGAETGPANAGPASRQRNQMDADARSLCSTRALSTARTGGRSARTADVSTLQEASVFY